MKRFERSYLVAEPFLPPLYKIVRRRLKAMSTSAGKALSILDVGGRKSHYTIGVPAEITISELPRETDVQKRLNLGINDGIRRLTLDRRSNVREIVYDDMTRSTLPTDAFDVVVSVEVLEHVEDDAAFVREVHRVLKPSGIFLMTTPNGDFVPNTNPDHKRHYTRLQLTERLRASFPQAHVSYAIRAGRWRTLGLKSWSPRHPIRTALSMVGNLVNTWQSAAVDENEARGARHLIATAVKQGPGG
ncbi:MAG: methyltransferase domain-containing protein [Acidobacteriota bacterium]